LRLNIRLAALIAAASLASTVVPAQPAPDPALLGEIMAIRAIDHHGHPMLALAPGEKDREASLNDDIPPEVLPVKLRTDYVRYREAWKALYGYPHSDASKEHLEELYAAKERIKREKGDAYPAWVLDQLGIETMLVNRFAMGKGLEAPRFRWVAYANPFLFPLDNSLGKASNPQREEDLGDNEKRLGRYLEESKLAALPEDLEAYIAKFMVPWLERRKGEGALAVKFYHAYVRSLDAADVPAPEAARIFATYRAGKVPPAAEYKALQDYLFRRIALECGRIGLAVHIHVGAGAGGWFHNSGASPFLLDSVLNDPPLRKTTFVLVHGGLPHAAATKFLLDKGNVYVDFSSQGFLTSAREMSAVLRSWLEFRPERVMFGTDAYPMSRALGWEEIGWLSSQTGRMALALALTGMVADGEITRERASALARMVMRENAMRLYRLK
jgi:uncharacterized protein